MAYLNVNRKITKFKVFLFATHFQSVDGKGTITPVPSLIQFS